MSTLLYTLIIQALTRIYLDSLTLVAPFRQELATNWGNAPSRALEIGKYANSRPANTVPWTTEQQMPHFSNSSRASSATGIHTEESRPEVAK